MSHTGAFGGLTGFTLLVWTDVRPARQPAPELKDATACELIDLDGSPSSGDRSGGCQLPFPEELEDATVLLRGRWNLNVERLISKGQWYLWVTCTRFTVSDETVRRAFGDLANLISWQKGSAGLDFKTAVGYKQCRDKYGVPQVIVEKTDGYGEGPSSRKRGKYQ